MDEREFYIMQFYRHELGDVGITDMPSVGETFPGAEKALAELLIAFNRDENRRPQNRPHHARLVAMNGSILMCLRALPGGNVERLWKEHPHAHRT